MPTRVCDADISRCSRCRATRIKAVQVEGFDQDFVRSLNQRDDPIFDIVGRRQDQDSGIGIGFANIVQQQQSAVADELKSIVSWGFRPRGLSVFGGADTVDIVTQLSQATGERDAWSARIFDYEGNRMTSRLIWKIGLRSG